MASMGRKLSPPVGPRSAVASATVAVAASIATPAAAPSRKPINLAIVISFDCIDNPLLPQSIRLAESIRQILIALQHSCCDAAKGTFIVGRRAGGRMQNQPITANAGAALA